ncbi:RNA polymerase II transcription factor SIII subunit A-domain-containing protein, partial [Vararia minispora EC-137]
YVTSDISGFGDSISFDLVRPILEHCSAEALMRIEDASPVIFPPTLFLWQRRCSRDMPLDSEQYIDGDQPPPPSWRFLYEELAQIRARKLELAGSRLRNSRLDEEQRRKERDVKLTDKPPPVKKLRPCGSPTQPKTLFQKTRTEASKMQRIFDKQMRPPMSVSKSYRSSSNVVSTKVPLLPLPSIPSTNVNSRITVRPISARLHETAFPALEARATSPPATMTASRSDSAHRHVDPSAVSPPLSSPTSSGIPARQIRPLPSGKKPPTSALFMPKHRAHSQLPSRIAVCHTQPPS